MTFMLKNNEVVMVFKMIQRMKNEWVLNLKMLPTEEINEVNIINS